MSSTSIFITFLAAPRAVELTMSLSLSPALEPYYTSRYDLRDVRNTTVNLQFAKLEWHIYGPQCQAWECAIDYFTFMSIASYYSLDDRRTIYIYNSRMDVPFMWGSLRLAPIIHCVLISCDSFDCILYKNSQFVIKWILHSKPNLWYNIDLKNVI